MCSELAAGKTPINCWKGLKGSPCLKSNFISPKPTKSDGVEGEIQSQKKFNYDFIDVD